MISFFPDTVPVASVPEDLKLLPKVRICRPDWDFLGGLDRACGRPVQACLDRLFLGSASLDRDCPDLVAVRFPSSLPSIYKMGPHGVRADAGEDFSRGNTE